MRDFKCKSPDTCVRNSECDCIIPYDWNCKSIDREAFYASEKLLTSDKDMAELEARIRNSSISTPNEDSNKSQRLNTGKPQCNEIDPAFILGIAKVLTKSREKYDRANWTKSTDWRTPYDSAMRHLLAFQSGEDNDAETGQSHLLHCATNLMFLHYYANTQPENDDRIFKKKDK